MEKSCASQFRSFTVLSYWYLRSHWLFVSMESVVQGVQGFRGNAIGTVSGSMSASSVGSRKDPSGGTRGGTASLSSSLLFCAALLP